MRAVFMRMMNRAVNVMNAVLRMTNRTSKVMIAAWRVMNGSWRAILMAERQRLFEYSRGSEGMDWTGLNLNLWQRECNA